jgi:preprotein translocase subunit Sec61beta
MIVKSPEKVNPPEAVKSPSKLVLLLTGIFLVCYFVSFWEQAQTPLWMDEVLAVWTAQMPSAHDVVSALYHGAEFSPPTYHLLLYALTHATGHGGYRMLRLPSILGSMTSGLCIFALVRRYFGVHAAGFGIAFALLSFWSSFALEIRPYALVVACFACAVLLWDGLEEHGQPLWRVGLMAVCLAGAVSLHFYSTLLVACVGLMEVFWSYTRRRLRLPVWIGLGAAGGSLLIWLPLLRTLSRYNAGDTASPGYYARPVFDHLLDTYVVLSLAGKRQVLFFAAALCFVTAAYLRHKSRLPGETALEQFPDREKVPATNFYIIAFSAIAYPLLVYCFAVFITKTDNLRYNLVAGLGFALLAAFLISRIPAFRRAVPFFLVTACALAFLRPEPVGVYANVREVNAVLDHATKPYPIVVSEGLQYFQLEEGLPDSLKSRLVYVTAPEGVASPDPTNENQVKRWIPLRPNLKIMDAKTFLARNPRFYLLHTGGTVGILTNWFLQQGMLKQPVADLYDIWLFEGESRPDQLPK